MLIPTIVGEKLETEIAQALGRAIRALRLEANISQEELAFAAGINRNYVSSLELGQKSASFAMVFRIATALQVNPAQLVTAVLNDMKES